MSIKADFCVIKLNIQTQKKTYHRQRPQSQSAIPAAYGKEE